MVSDITMDMIKPFTGEVDVVSWPMAEKGDFGGEVTENIRFSLYLELSEEDQESAEKIQEKLKVAFADDAFSAFGKLVQNEVHRRTSRCVHQ